MSAAPTTDDRLAAAVARSAADAADLVAQGAVASAWASDSVLDGMTVGGLAAHLAQMIGGLATWLDGPAPDPGAFERQGLADGYGATARLGSPGSGPARTVLRWANDAAAAGPAAVAAQAAADASRLPARLAAARGDRLVPSALVPGVAMTLDDYLATRCVEFVVHTDDLAVSVGLSVEVDPVATAVAVDTLVALCRARAGDRAVLVALAGRGRADAEALRAL